MGFGFRVRYRVGVGGLDRRDCGFFWGCSWVFRRYDEDEYVKIFFFFSLVCDLEIFVGLRVW